MNYTKIEQLVYEDEMMELKNKNILNSTLLKLEENREYRNQYFGTDLSKYNADNYANLKKLYYSELDKKDKLEYIASKLAKFNINSDKLDNLIDTLDVCSKIKKERFEKFRTDLSYLLYLGIISKREAVKRGFTSKDIKRLKNRASCEMADIIDAYIDASNSEKQIIKKK